MNYFFEVIFRILMLAILLNIYPKLFSYIMKSIKVFYYKTKFAFEKIYRVLNVKKSSDFVWKELLSHHKASSWNFGQFDKDRRIECSFTVDESNTVDFYYNVTKTKLIFNAVVLKNFNEELTNDILVLASHFNGLLSFGVVKVDLKYSYVEMTYYGDILNYSIFPGEIDNDMTTHYHLVKDCYWTFQRLIETGDDPVFVFSELMRKKEENDNKTS